VEHQELLQLVKMGGFVQVVLIVKMHLQHNVHLIQQLEVLAFVELQELLQLVKKGGFVQVVLLVKMHHQHNVCAMTQ